MQVALPIHHHLFGEDVQFAVIGADKKNGRVGVLGEFAETLFETELGERRFGDRGGNIEGPEGEGAEDATVDKTGDHANFVDGLTIFVGTDDDAQLLAQ